MLYGFDLDGTLVDSRAAVLQAYRDVGADPPADFFTKPWKTWLTDQPTVRKEAVHAAKNARYIEIIRAGGVKPLALAKVFRELDPTKTVILTGASRVAANAICLAVLKAFPGVLLCEMTIGMKIEWMLRNGGDEGIMFEDQLAHAHKMKQETKWTICHAL